MTSYNEAIYQDNAVRQTWIEALIDEGLGHTEMRVARMYLDALATAGYHVLQEGQVPPWMEAVYVDCDPTDLLPATTTGDVLDLLTVYRLRPLTEPPPVVDEMTTTTTMEARPDAR